MKMFVYGKNNGNRIMAAERKPPGGGHDASSSAQLSVLRLAVVVVPGRRCVTCGCETKKENDCVVAIRERCARGCGPRSRSTATHARWEEDAPAAARGG